MITSMMGRMADAEKLSIPQLQMAIKNGTIPAYVGVPLLQDKVKQQQQAMAMQQQQGQDQVPLAAQVMQEADQYRGIDELPTNLPTEEDAQTIDDEYANGGIIAFADTGAVKEPKKSFWDTVDPAKYQADPAYKAFVDEPDTTDKTYKNYLELGNTPPLTKDELSRARYDNAVNVEKNWFNSPEGQQAVIQAQQMGEIQPVLPSKVNEQVYTEFTNDPKLSTRIVESKMGLGRGDLARMQAAQANPVGSKTPAATASLSGRNEGTLLPRTPAYSSEPVDDKQYQDSIAVPPNAVSNWWAEHMAKIKKENEAAAAARGQPLTSPVFPKRISEAEGAQAEMLQAEAASPGVAGLPAAQNVQTTPGQRSAGTTAPAGSERLTPKVGLENAPSTLSQAEAVAGKSPAAAQAVSMLDEFIADLKKSGQNVSRDKKEALYMALIKGGLAAAGGTSPNALANIAAGMVPAMEGYSKDIAGIRKDERARLEKLIAAGVSKEKIGLEAKKLGITEKHFDQMYNAKMAQLGVMGGQRADARAQAEDMKRLSVAQGIFGTLKKDQLMSGASDEDLWTKAQVMAGQIEAPAAPKNKFPGFSLVTPKK